MSLPTGLHTDRDFTFSERSGCNSGNDVSKLRPSSYLYEFWPGGGNTGDGLRGEDGREKINKIILKVQLLMIYDFVALFAAEFGFFIRRFVKLI